MNVTLGSRTAETVAVYFGKTRSPAIRKTLPQKAQTLEEALADFRKTQESGAVSFGRTIYADGQYAGDVWCYCMDPDGDPQAMVSYCVFEQALWGRGTATKALGLFLSEIREQFGLERVGAFTFAANTASIRVLEKTASAWRKLSPRMVWNPGITCARKSVGYIHYKYKGEPIMAMDMTYFDAMEAKIPHGKIRTRFAPSPTGYMHVGNLRTALYTWLIARNGGGTFILRIEDTDQGRLVEGATDVIYRTMKECGLNHDEGPDVGGPVAPYIQSQRRDTYGKYAKLLVEKGHAYYCFCEKTESEEDSGEFNRAADPCRNLSPEEAQARMDAGEPYVIRQRIPDTGTTTFHDAIFGDITVENSTLDDQVLLKRDGLPTYNFANVIDDHLMGITHVVRGSEYLSSAPKYNLLYEGFGWEVPTYVHCSPVMRDQHNKMSKRHGDPSYEDLKAQGYLTEAILNYVALLGWSPRGDKAEQEVFSLQELAEVFDIAGISKSPAIFDIEKLTHFNALYLRAMSPEAFHAVAEPYIRQAVKNPALDTKAIAALLQARCEKLTEIPEKVDFFDTLPVYEKDLFTNKKSKTNDEVSKQMLESAIPAMKKIGDWTQESIHDCLMDLAAKLEVKNATLMWPVRIAAAGRAVTPGGAVEICQILGRDECLRRLNIGLEMLKA